MNMNDRHERAMKLQYSVSKAFRLSIIGTFLLLFVVPCWHRLTDMGIKHLLVINDLIATRQASSPRSIREKGVLFPSELVRRILFVTQNFRDSTSNKQQSSERPHPTSSPHFNSSLLFEVFTVERNDEGLKFLQESSKKNDWR